VPPTDLDLPRLERRLRASGASGLLPARLAASVRLAGEPVVRDGLPLSGDAVLAVVDCGGETVITPVVVRDGELRRARAGDGAFAAIAEVLAAGTPVGRFVPRPFGPVPTGGDERAIDVDQSNDSMVVGDAAVVKVYARTTPGPQPGLDLPAHLAAVGFARTPTPHGVLVWEGASDRPTLLASVTRYLPGATDGWDWYVALLLRWLDGDASDVEVHAPAAEIGALVADLHRALATPSEVFPTPVTTAGRDAVAAWRARAEATLAEALEVAVEETRPRLQALAPRVGPAFDAFDAVDETPVLRIHGDLHVGQVLRSGEGYAVSDLDGNPLAPPVERVRPDAAARDVASMARAIDHVGRVAQRRRPERDGEVEGWIAEARGGFLEAYRVGLGPEAHLFDERLLFPFEVAQECHEHVYAARYLPRWSYVPDRALPALLEASA
jgi:maltokinase